ncbi:hypothetical protein KP509_32G067000 [Ceratopteris richardii]|uniref:Uncharacterized protein n=1 Tax=Ceratopteris richardii TaxID=49495 RepID=A0A8T2QUH3_CERRI|nr:hypothetical protein KP509_32G067000 [Ceratopteris richardii]
MKKVASLLARLNPQQSCANGVLFVSHVKLAYWLGVRAFRALVIEGATEIGTLSVFRELQNLQRRMPPCSVQTCTLGTSFSGRPSNISVRTFDTHLHVLGRRRRRRFCRDSSLAMFDSIQEVDEEEFEDNAETEENNKQCPQSRLEEKQDCFEVSCGEKSPLSIHSSSSSGFSSSTLSASFSSSSSTSYSSTRCSRSYRKPCADCAHRKRQSYYLMYPCAPLVLGMIIMVLLQLLLPVVLPPLPPPPALLMLFPMAIMLSLVCTALSPQSKDMPSKLVVRGGLPHATQTSSECQYFFLMLDDTHPRLTCNWFEQQPSSRHGHKGPTEHASFLMNLDQETCRSQSFVESVLLFAVDMKFVMYQVVAPSVEIPTTFKNLFILILCQLV